LVTLVVAHGALVLLLGESNESVLSVKPQRWVVQEQSDRSFRVWPQGCVDGWEGGKVWTLALVGGETRAGP
jgi:hypothetical protein